MAPKIIEDAIDAAEDFGREHGHAAATWVLDGNSSDADARYVLDGIEDPGANDFGPRAPLSGEFADDLTPSRLYGMVGLEDEDPWVPEDLDAIATAYEDAYVAAFYAEAERSARIALGEDAAS